MNDIETIRSVEKSALQLALPAVAYTRSGIAFDPRDDEWKYTDGPDEVCINFRRLTNLAANLRLVFKHVMLWYVNHQSSNHVLNIFKNTVAFVKWIGDNYAEPTQEVNQYHIVSYYSHLAEDRKHVLGVLKVMLKKWSGLGYPGVTPDAIHALSQLRIKGNRKGKAVATLDPIKGPFTEIERQAIMVGLEEAFANQRISCEDYLLTCLFSLLGQRPIQYASLKLCDVLLSLNTHGERLYFLNVPRAKQRNKLRRSEFKMRPLIPQVGEVLLAHVNAVRQRFDRPEYRDMLPDISNAPLFPSLEQDNDAPGFQYHMRGKDMTNSLKATVKKLNVISERTGKPIHINGYRFRYTVGTNAALEGHGELVIAEILDHSDTQHVQVYVKSTPAIIDRIDRAVAMKLAPMAQAFAGKIIRVESEATRGDDPRSRIRDPKIEPSMKCMGSCGHFGFCGFAAPIACYTCPSFEPWLDGPHEAVLAYLLKDRARVLEGSGKRMASVNDRTILAVAEVIQRCDTIMKADKGIAYAG
jgi:integrase